MLSQVQGVDFTLLHGSHAVRDYPQTNASTSQSIEGWNRVVVELNEWSVSTVCKEH